MMVSIRGKLTEFGNVKQPHSESAFGYLGEVEKRPDPREVLRDNVESLMRAKYGKTNKNRFAKFTGIGLGSVTRIYEAKTSVGLEVIDSICAKFDLMPWQLLVPGFDPAHKPVLARAGLSEQQWYQLIAAAETVAEYSKSLRSQDP